MFEDLEVPEQAYSHQARIAIFRYDKHTYEAKIIDEFFEFDKPFLVKDLKLTIPKSHISKVGDKYFGNFLAMAFKLMSKATCTSPYAVFKPLRKKLRRLKRKFLKVNANNQALSWYLLQLRDMVSRMWLAARNNYVRWLTDQRERRKYMAILEAQIITLN